MNIERMKRNISMIFLLYIFLLCSSILSFSLGSVTGFFFSGFFRRIYYRKEEGLEFESMGLRGKRGV